MSAADAGPERIFVWTQEAWAALKRRARGAWRGMLDQLIDRWDRGIGPSTW